MLHYANITDTIRNSPGPFVVERPKVLYNEKTGKYVMWMLVDNHARTLGLAGVAISDYPDGPFDFMRTLYPDGNETRDQTVWKAPDGRAYLGRTYYTDVEYVLPAPVMQPLWESVKGPDGLTDFGLSFHRSTYSSDYDNFHDIYLQRWRVEDRPWKVMCVHRITGERREVQRGDSIADVTNATLNPVNMRDVCIDPDEYKVIIGQGYPAVPSRFKDPTDPKNNDWRPTSVPGVRAQPWRNNYLDGSCGIRDLEDNMDRNDPGIEGFKGRDRADCSNIVDNPLHSTPPDKLNGMEQVVETRRAKYVAVSQLTEDYLDTNGVLLSFEGELENEQDLIALLMEHGQFGFSSGEDVGSTFEPPVTIREDFRMASDWDTRFHQYEDHYNDRADYSLACVLSDSCPVNFKDQISDSHK